MNKKISFTILLASCLTISLHTVQKKTDDSSYQIEIKVEPKIYDEQTTLFIGQSFEGFPVKIDRIDRSSSLEDIGNEQQVRKMANLVSLLSPGARAIFNKDPMIEDID
jgi:hypothetical protein